MHRVRAGGARWGSGGAVHPAEHISGRAPRAHVVSDERPPFSPLVSVRVRVGVSVVALCVLHPRRLRLPPLAKLLVGRRAPLLEHVPYTCTGQPDAHVHTRMRCMLEHAMHITCSSMRACAALDASALACKGR